MESSGALLTILLILLPIMAAGGLGAGWFLSRSKSGDGRDMQQELQRKADELTRENADLTARLETKVAETATLQKELGQTRERVSALEGKGKEQYAAALELKNKVQNLEEERSRLHKQVQEYEARAAQHEKTRTDELQKLEESRKSLEDERLRIRREDEAEQERIKENQRRLWNEHEGAVLAALRELCQLPELSFSFYENTALPEEFSGALKPDALIAFLGQYIIFDAKKTESEDVPGFLATQVKNTVAKLKKADAPIAQTVFFVLPHDHLPKLKKPWAHQEGYTFYFVGTEGLAPILASLKKVTEYEFAEQFDPQERENIVHALATYEWFIQNQNAANLFLAEKAVETLHAQRLGEDIRTEVDLRRAQHPAITRLKEADMKRLTRSPEALSEKISELTAPSAPIEPKKVKEAGKLFEEDSFGGE